MAASTQQRRTDQRGSAGAPAERLVEGGAAELQLLQVAVGNPDIGRQGQALVDVLGGREKLGSPRGSCHGSGRSSPSKPPPPPIGGAATQPGPLRWMCEEASGTLVLYRMM